MSDCRIISVAQQKGGAGKTTLAAHLAIALSQKGNRVAAIDIDPQGSLSSWHSVRSSKYGNDFTGITFISKPGWRVNTEISSLRNKLDFIIIDSPPHNETDAKTAIRASDLVLIPLQPSPTDLWATQTTINFCKQNKIKYKIVLNRVSHNSKLLPSITKDLDNILKSSLGNRIAFAASLLEGKCITETQPSSPAAAEIKQLVNELTRLLFKEENKKIAV